MQSDPQIDPRLAVDLSKRQAPVAPAERVIDEAYAKAWERGMNRMFKGIISRPERLRMLREATR